MESVQIKEYMNHYPVTFTEDMSVEEASLRFLKTKQIGGPVIDKHNRLIGFLSESDVLAKMLESIYYNEQIANVSDIMVKEPKTAKPYESIMELGQQMLRTTHKVYPVVDEDGYLLGSVCRNDELIAIDKHMRSHFDKSA